MKNVMASQLTLTLGGGGNWFATHVYYLACNVDPS